MGYHRRSVVETAMFRIKTLLGGYLSLRNYDAQVGEAMAMLKALNWMTLLAMRPASGSYNECSGGSPVSLSLADSELFNKASCCHNLPDADKVA